MEEGQVHLLRVSPGGPDGDGTLSVILSDRRMSDEEMREVASSYGHMSGFVFPTRAGSDCDYEIRFWDPRYELENCAHAMIGTVWLISKLGMMSGDRLYIWSKTGRVEARIMKAPDQDNSIWVEFSYPKCTSMENVANKYIDAIRHDLKIRREDLIPGSAIQNAGMIRKVKTLIPIKSIAKLNELELEHALIRKNLGRIKSNSVCLYATDDHKPYEYELRQVPENWRDWEETASALAFGVLVNGVIRDPNQMLKIRQCLDEDRHREINVRFRTWGSSVSGLWIGGTAEFETEKRETGKTKNWETDPE
ncbi:Phenazine biosynthesis PhzC/PhzF protein [Penicillium camemberti]|uniref:Phenazine biosynthesis PhzC/PhzF protein n=1 Tax=Penicillium camemberti (strain FM 013) TaxID=1429867 RepID=A0A0G4NXG5_PENC3|nr:Phenazine biosynthesis PhzC/PhzF protein [Penicillium camemberti]